MLRALCGAWLVPAASLVWMGFASTGLREVDDHSLSLALGRTQALAVLLAIFTVPVAATAFLRSDPAPHRLCPIPVGRLLGLALAAPVAGAGVVWPSLAPVLFPVAALAGFWTGLAVAYRLLGRGTPDSGPLAALVVGVAFQLTVGWLHLAHPAGVASPALVAEGLILAWAATAAARVEPFPEASEVVPVPELPVAAPVVAPSLSQVPVPRSLPEAAVGR